MKKRKDGRYVKTIVDERTGKRIFFYGSTEREVLRKIMEYETKAERGRTFKEVADEWWNENEYRWASQSLKPYKAAFARAIEAFGDDPISGVSAKDILALFRSLAVQKYSRKTISNQRSVINQIFDHAVLSGDVGYNVCKTVKLPPLANAGERRSAASPEDEERIKAHPDSWLFPFIALYTGMRKGEILALQWQDIDFKKNIIKVNKSVYHEGDKGKVKAPKTSESNRIIPLLAPLREVLEEKRGKAQDYIISDDGKTPLTQRRYETLYATYKREVGISCTAHQIRHSFATIAIAQGIPAKTIQEILGHRHISTTLDIYTELRESSIKDAEKALNSAFSH